MEVGVAGVWVVREPHLSTQGPDLNHAGYRGNPGTVGVCVCWGGHFHSLSRSRLHFGPLLSEKDNYYINRLFPSSRSLVSQSSRVSSPASCSADRSWSAA